MWASLVCALRETIIFRRALVGGHCRLDDVESTDNDVLGCQSRFNSSRLSSLSESLPSICSHAHSVLNITNAVHTRSPFLSSDSRRSGWYFVTRRECSLSSACLRLTPRPKTCSRVFSTSGSVLVDVADEVRQRDRSSPRAPFQRTSSSDLRLGR